MFRQVEIAASNHGMKLVDGKGNDPDTLGKRIVYVMDSNVFPFHQAEVCKFVFLFCLSWSSIIICCVILCGITHSSILPFSSPFSFAANILCIKTDHQYHNDFLTPAYGKEYNDLVNAAFDDGRIKMTGCPDRV